MRKRFGRRKLAEPNSIRETERRLSHWSALQSFTGKEGRETDEQHHLTQFADFKALEELLQLQAGERTCLAYMERNGSKGRAMEYLRTSVDARDRDTKPSGERPLVRRKPAVEHRRRRRTMANSAIFLPLATPWRSGLFRGLVGALTVAALEVIAVEIVSKLRDQVGFAELPRCPGIKIRDCAARKRHPRCRACAIAEA